MKLVESKVTLDENGHIMFEQCIQNDEGETPQWYKTDMTTLSPKADESGLTSEDAFLLGITALKDASMEEVRAQLENEGVIYLSPPAATA